MKYVKSLGAHTHANFDFLKCGKDSFGSGEYIIAIQSHIDTCLKANKTLKKRKYQGLLLKECPKFTGPLAV